MKNDYYKEIKGLIDEWIKLDYIEPQDIPAIELYMDQVTTFMDKQLAGNKRDPEDKILTKTMINNYSKNNLLPPSHKKRYSRDHLILLIYIYYLKNFLTITDIQNMLSPMSDSYFETEDNAMYEIYKDMLDLEKNYSVNVSQSIKEMYDVADKAMEGKSDYLKTIALIILLSYDIYTKKRMVEKLIDGLSENK